MKCVVCKLGDTREGHTTVTLEREGAALVVRKVPAQVCANWMVGREIVEEEQFREFYLCYQGLLEILHAPRAKSARLPKPVELVPNMIPDSSRNRTTRRPRFGPPSANNKAVSIDAPGNTASSKTMTVTEPNRRSRNSRTGPA